MTSRISWKRLTLKTKGHGRDAEDGWFFHLEDICRLTFYFLVVNLIADSPFVDEQVKFDVIIIRELKQ